MARKYNMDGSYTIRNSDGATKVFPDGKRFYMNAGGQKALQKYYKDNNFIRVQTGTTSSRQRYYTGPPKAGGSGYQYRTVTNPTYGWLPSRPFVVQSKPAPAAAPAPAPAPSRPQPAAAPKPTIKAPTASAAANLTVGNRPTTVSGPSVADQVAKGIAAFKKSEAARLAKIEAERKAAEEKKRRAEAIAARPNTVEGQQALKITQNVGAQLPGMGGFEGGPLSTIRSKLLTI